MAPDDASSNEAGARENGPDHNGVHGPEHALTGPIDLWRTLASGRRRYVNSHGQREHGRHEDEQEDGGSECQRSKLPPHLGPPTSALWTPSYDGNRPKADVAHSIASEHHPRLRSVASGHSRGYSRGVVSGIHHDVGRIIPPEYQALVAIPVFAPMAGVFFAFAVLACRWIVQRVARA